jgi:peptidoglycan/xylan/chitin deacetylase (PgdA/CDA1 family)
VALLWIAATTTPLFADPPGPVSPTNQTAAADDAAGAAPPASVPAQAVEEPSATPSPATAGTPLFHTIGSGPSGEKRIALTFDDGPDPVITPKVLGELRTHGVKATFFVLGERVRLHPEILREMVAEGHEIGNHTYSHPHLLRLSNEEIEDEITRTQSLIQQVIGYEPSLFRPPYGAFRPETRAVFEKHHLNVILWSVDPKDWSIREEGAMDEDLVSHVRNGSIILCHDIHHAIVDALPRILDTLLAGGYQFATVSGLCGLPSPARGETIPVDQPSGSLSPTQ